MGWVGFARGVGWGGEGGGVVRGMSRKQCPINIKPRRVHWPDTASIYSLAVYVLDETRDEYFLNCFIIRGVAERFRVSRGAFVIERRELKSKEKTNKEMRCTDLSFFIHTSTLSIDNSRSMGLCIYLPLSLAWHVGWTKRRRGGKVGRVEEIKRR
jgi:hypothetical protein